MIHRKIEKNHTETINLKYQLQRRMIKLNYLTDPILYQIFKIILSIPSKSMKKSFNKNIKTRHYLKLLTPYTIKSFGSTKCKITKVKNGESMSRLKITEVVLIHCNIVKNDCQ